MTAAEVSRPVRAVPAGDAAMDVGNEDFKSAKSISWNFLGRSCGDEVEATMTITKLLNRLIGRACFGYFSFVS
jgi:hypothetical protein